MCHMQNKSAAMCNCDITIEQYRRLSSLWGQKKKKERERIVNEQTNQRKHSKNIQEEA